MKNTGTSASVLRSVVALGLCLVVTILTRTPIHAQPGQPIFEPGFEGEVWTTQPPDKIGKRVQPPCIPESAWTWDEELGYEDAGTSCSPAEQWAQEETQRPTGGHNQLLFPTGVAVYDPPADASTRGLPTERRVLVADRYNHRILSFRPGPNGTWISIANSADAGDIADVQAADWNGFNWTAPAAFDGMAYPEHLAVDAGGNVWVADLERNRIDVFTIRGEFLQAFPLTDIVYTDRPGDVLFPYGIALTDGAQYGVGGNVAIVAQDYLTQGTHLIVLSAADGTEIGRLAPDPFAGAYDAPGALNLATDVDYYTEDGVDRLVVADTNNNRIQIFETDAAGAPLPNPVLIFGVTALNDAQGNPISASRLQWPYSLHVDNRGRVLVSDSIGNREAFYRVSFTGTPSVQFLYELNARGGLNGVPRGVAEDSEYRLYIVDTGNHEVEVFEIPELAVVNVNLISPTTQPGQTVTVEFDVLVPETKSALPTVMPTCAAVSSNLTPLSGPTPIAGTPPALPVPMMNPVPAGGVYRYRCEFTADVTPGPFEIALSATGGPGGVVTAPIKSAIGRIVDCAGTCETRPPTIASAATSDPPPVATDIGVFYPGDATITLTATDPGGPNQRSGIARIYWKWVSSSAMNLARPTDPCPDVPSPVQCVLFPSPGQQSQTQDVVAVLDGVSTLEYWTEDFDGNQSAHGRIQVTVDTLPPDVFMAYGSIVPAGAWFNTDVTIDLSFADPLGLTPASRIIKSPDVNDFLFTGEGRLLVQSINVQDLAGNASDWDSSALAVNIDRGAPQTTASTTEGPLTEDQVFTFPVTPTITLTSVDPTLSNGDEPSGVTNTYYTLDGGPVVQYRIGIDVIPVPTLGQHTIQYWSVDFANNEEGRVTRNFYNNAVPVASPDVASTNEDTAVTIAVLTNDVDANDRQSDPLTVAIVSPPNPAQGTATVNPDGTIRFTPAPNFNGVATFSYRIADAHGATSEPVLVVVTVNPANDAPVAANDSATTDRNVAVSIAVLANDSDPDGDSLTVIAVSTPANGFAVRNIDNTITYTPQTDYAGPDSFTYTISDSQGGTATATVSVTVTGTNHPPVAHSDSATTNRNVAVTIAVLANDSDPDGDSLTVSAVSTPANGSAVRNADNTITYTPQTDYTGPDSFTYTVSDGQGGHATTTVSVTVHDTNRPPVCGTASGGEIWPPNHKRFYVAAIKGVTDPEGKALRFRINAIWQDEPVDTTGDGKFSPDGSGINTATAMVRGERMGGGDGRVYRIYFTATDVLGASCQGVVEYGVPHDRGRGPAIAGPRWYDSTAVVPGARDKSQIHQLSIRP